MPLSPTIKQSFSRDKKSNLFEYIEFCFDQNEGNWRNFYPGLSLSTLKNHFFEFAGKGISFLSFSHQWTGGELLKKWREYFYFLKQGRPLSYITQRAFFFETNFFVDERVLIPRFETEILLDEIGKEVERLEEKGGPFSSSSSSSSSFFKLCEVGVGPGTLALSLAQKRYQRAIRIDAGDISDEALKICHHNYYRLGFKIPKENKVHLIKSDRLEKMKDCYHIIYSNPPYIKRNEDFSLVHSQVAKYEPEIALYLEDDDYEKWFAVFFKQVQERLERGGLFLMEGHENHLESLLEMGKELLSCSECSLVKDLAGRNRILKLRKD